mgnify:CR=1 FL=1
MVPIFVIAGTAIGMSAFVLLIQMAVRNGIRMSGLIDWRTQYELERIEMRTAASRRCTNCMRSRPRPIPHQMPSSGM